MTILHCIITFTPKTRTFRHTNRKVHVLSPSISEPSFQITINFKLTIKGTGNGGKGARCGNHCYL